MRRLLFILLCLASIASIKCQVPEQASPFTAVQWEGDEPIVRWEGDWYQFQSINGIDVKTIINYCKKNYERRWQKRFSEDFVEVLTNMGHTVAKNVTLVLIQNGTTYTRTGIMTEENRDQVRDFNNEDDTERTDDNNRGELNLKASQNALAEQMAAWMDKIWEETPPENTAYLRFEFFKDGKIFSGKIDIQGDFVFRAKSKSNHIQAFNPNTKGRWVFEDLPPGTYDISISGKNDFNGWTWSKNKVEVNANTSQLFTIHLE